MPASLWLGIVGDTRYRGFFSGLQAPKSQAEDGENRLAGRSEVADTANAIRAAHILSRERATLGLDQLQHDAATLEIALKHSGQPSLEAWQELRPDAASLLARFRHLCADLAPVLGSACLPDGEVRRLDPGA